MSETTREVKLSADLRKRLDAAAEAADIEHPWEEWEKLVLLEYYRRLGATGCAKFLPGRSVGAISNMAGRLNARRQKRFTLKEAGHA